LVRLKPMLLDYASRKKKFSVWIMIIRYMRYIWGVFRWLTDSPWRRKSGLLYCFLTPLFPKHPQISFSG
jgi:hypothetical protein